jgi:RNA polymerase sigma-70 factor (ECF subfamily)
MHRLTVNVVLGHQRSLGRRRTRETAAGEEWYGDGSVAAVRPGVAMDLERAIASLPERARTVFVLHDVEGYKHTEIAEVAGMAVGTSKAQLSRARRLLRKALKS